MKLRNTTGLKFEPVNEDWREYDISTKHGIQTIRIEKPRFVSIHPVHGAHRILDAQGVSHYVAGPQFDNGRIGLRWKVPVDAPHFSVTVATASK